MQRTDLSEYTLQYLRRKGLRKEVAEKAAALIHPLVLDVDSHAFVLFEDAHVDENGHDNLASAKAKEVIRAAADGLVANLKRRRWRSQLYLLHAIGIWGTSKRRSNLDEYDISGKIAVGRQERSPVSEIARLNEDFDPPWLTPYHIDPDAVRTRVRDGTHRWLVSRDAYAKSKDSWNIALATGEPHEPFWKRLAFVFIVLGVIFASGNYYLEVASDPLVSKQEIASLFETAKADAMNGYHMVKAWIGSRIGALP